MKFLINFSNLNFLNAIFILKIKKFEIDNMAKIFSLTFKFFYDPNY